MLLAEIYAAECAAHVHGLPAAEADMLRACERLLETRGADDPYAASATRAVIRVYEAFDREEDAARFRSRLEEPPGD